MDGGRSLSSWVCLASMFAFLSPSFSAGTIFIGQSAALTLRSDKFHFEFWRRRNRNDFRTLGTGRIRPPGLQMVQVARPGVRNPCVLSTEEDFHFPILRLLMPLATMLTSVYLVYTLFTLHTTLPLNIAHTLAASVYPIFV